MPCYDLDFIKVTKMSSEMQYIIISVVKNKNKTSKGRHKCKPSYEDM